MIDIEIFKLFGSIFVNNEDANKKIEDTDKKGQGVGKTLGEGVKTAAKWGTAIVTGATAAVGGLLAVTNQTAEYADEIDKLSERTGINREELQRWKYAAGQSGADIGKLETGIKTLSGYMDDAMNGSKKATEAFAALGISVDDLKNKSQEEMFEQVMNSLGDMEQGATRNAIGADLLGRSYTELLPLLNAGSQGMDDLKKRADELGLVMSEDAVKANVTFGDIMDDLKQSFGGIVRDLSTSFLPLLQQFAEFIIANMPAIQGILGNVFAVLGSSVESILPFLMDLIQNALPPLIELFTDIATNVLPPVITLFTQILQTILPPLIELFAGVIQTILPPLIKLFEIIVNDILPPFIELFNNVISAILPPLMELFQVIIDTLMPPLIELFQYYVDNILPILIEMWEEIFKDVLPPLIKIITEIVKVILPPLLDVFMDLARNVLPFVMEVFRALQPVIEPVMKAISAVINIVLAAIKGDWEGVWNGLKDFFVNIWDAIVKVAEGLWKILGNAFQRVSDTVTGIWDGLVNGIKGAINWIIDGINAFIKGINKLQIPDWVPGVGGKGLNIKLIPRLEQGGVIEQSGRVLVGERGPEFLDLPRGAVVSPLAAAGGITVNIYDPHLFNSRDADKLGDLIANRIRQKTGLRI